MFSSLLALAFLYIAVTTVADPVYDWFTSWRMRRRSRRSNETR